MTRTFLLGLFLLAASFCAEAQAPDDLPLPSAYKGEIRRGADGRLMVLDAEEQAKGASDGAPRPATMFVGEREKITTITEAAKLARDGEVIEIRPGDYRGQPAVWTQRDLLIRGTGTRPVMIADGRTAEGYAIWVVRGGNVQIENIEFRGARAPSGHGAGVRFQAGHLVVRRCAFYDNEMGILTENIAEMTLDVSDSEFGAAPHHAGQLHHLLYVGAIGRFKLSGSRFESGYLGHLVKSRARENDVRYNMLVDGSDGGASYELEFPNGGVAYVIGNVIGQSAGTDNPELVSFGAEGPRWPDNALFLAHNTLLNDFDSGTFLKVWTEKFPDNIETWVVNNLTVGYGDWLRPAQGRFEGNRAAQRRDLIEYGGVPLRLNNISPLRGSVKVPGQARGVDLMPTAEFTFPAGTRAIYPGSSLAPGALQ